MSTATAHRRFWDGVDKDSGECWIWRRRITPDGYGISTYAYADRPKWLAHRLAYTLTRGPIPDDLTLDHLCRVRNCVNPMHLEIITRSENSTRSWRTLTRTAAERKPMRNRVVREEDAYWLAAQMEAAVSEVDLSDSLRGFIRKHGKRHHDAARKAWAELEAAAPSGVPTRGQVRDFLEQYREDYREGKR